MKYLYRAVAITVFISAIGSTYVTYSQGAITVVKDANVSGLHDFDFLVGEWRVHHRVLNASKKWNEFDGTASNRPLMEGWANVE